MQEKLMVKRPVAMRDSRTLVGRQMPLVWIRRFPEMVSNLLVEVSGREGRLREQGGVVRRG